MRQLEEHMSRNNFYDPLQSAYKINHSTETTIWRLPNDIIKSLDDNKCTLLASLDLSAEFDTPEFLFSSEDQNI